MNRRGFLVLLLTASAALSLPVHAQRAPATKPSEAKPMSDANATSAIEADVTAALANYDRTHAATALREAADQAMREDGAAPADPAQGLVQARSRLKLWLAIFARFKRDLDPDFDPKNPPPLKAPAPMINGRQMPPFSKASDLTDPDERRQYDEQIAVAQRKVEMFTAMLKLDAIHDTVLENAVASIRDARDTLGLPAAEISMALEYADLAPADRRALQAAAAP